MNLIGGLILSIVILAVLLAPRRGALIGMMAGVLYLTQGQNMQVFGFNMFAIRFVEIAGFIRVMSRKEFSFRKLNKIDKAFLFLYCYTTIVFLLRTKVDQIYGIGVAVDAFLCYFIFRGLIDGIENFRWFLRAFLILLAPYTILVLTESFTGRNPFASMGGVVLTGESWVRGGRIRCQGSFRHASLLGTLGATFLPLYIGLWFKRGDRLFSICGITLCSLIVWACNSGGPLNCAAIGVLGWVFWGLRRRMQLVRRSLAAGTILMALIMKAPIWYLPAKASSLTGGDGWHRSYLMDIAFQNLDKWWLAGMPILDTQYWFDYTLAATGAADITNEFLSFGLSSGMGGLISFIYLLVIAFKKLGEGMSIVRITSRNANEYAEYTLWSLGVVLTAHMFNWLGITYFDQTYVIWFLQLAAISSLSEICLSFPIQGEKRRKSDEALDPKSDQLQDTTRVSKQFFAR